MSFSSDKKFIFKLFFSPVFERKKDFTLLLLALILLSLSQSLFLLLIGPFLKALFSVHDAAEYMPLSEFLTPSLQSFFPSMADITLRPKSLIYWVPGLLLLAILLKSLAGYLYQIKSFYFSLLVAKNYRERLFESVLFQPYRMINKRSPAEWMSMLMNDVLFLQDKFSDIVNGLLKDFTLIIATLLTLFFVHWQTALIFLFLTPFLAWSIGSVGKKISRFSDQRQKKLSEISDFVLDNRKRFDLIKAHNAEDYEHRRFEKTNLSFFETVYRSIFVRSVFAPSLEFLSYSILAALLFFLSMGWMGESFSPADMILFLAVIAAMMKPLRQIGEQLTRFHETKGALQESLSLILKTKDPKAKDEMSNEKKSLPQDIRVEGFQVYFEKKSVIEIQNLLLKKGKSIAVVGPSGSGKSTLLRTFSGLIESENWRSNCKAEDLAHESSFVSQIPFLFNDTLLQNLTYGLDYKDHRDKDIESQLRRVSMWEELSKFSEGLNSEIKAISSNVSGGQKQRLVLARALLRDKSILILDEASSSVDPNMEETIVRKLLEWVREKNRIMLSVTHRLNLLSCFDEIWFMVEGKILSIGSLDELLQEERFKAFYDASL